MIEVEIAKSGQPVLKKDGRLLASSVDPQREAVKWADLISASAPPDDLVVVLGLGSGYHVLELMLRRPASQILVIESDRELFEITLRHFPDLCKVRILIEPVWQNLMNSEVFCGAVEGVYSVAVHGPSASIDSEFVKAVEVLLRGRDPKAFFILLKRRPELQAILQKEEVAHLEHEQVNIKTLQRLFGHQPSVTRERRLWRILEELVL